MENIEDYVSEHTVLNILNKYIIHRDHTHELHVKMISLNLFDALSDSYTMTNAERSLLKISALLHDIGYFINKEDHHKHSKYIILNDGIFDRVPTELRYSLALICENHRKTAPMNIDFLDLSKKQCLLRLTAILRMADALDHKNIQDVSIEYLNRNTINVKIQFYNEFSDHFIKKLSKKSTLFNELFGVNIVKSVSNM